MEFKINVPTFEFEGKKRVDLGRVADQLAQLPSTVIRDMLLHLMIAAQTQVQLEHLGRGPHFAAHLMLHNLVNRGVIGADVQLNETP